jgi:hypothetical protein
MIIVTMMIWLFRGKSWTIIFAIIKFYGLRAIIQYLYNMPFPSTFTFYYPGVPSFAVNYQKTNDFFYSGHCGIPILCGLEFKRNNMNFMFYICLFISFFESFIMVSTRAHYGIDIIIGMIVAHYFFILTECYIEVIDNSYMNNSKEEEERESLIVLKSNSKYEL